ncbi:MAG: hypothetical protein QW103_01705 [Candidatus Pacearchaeota archaeon]
MEKNKFENDKNKLEAIKEANLALKIRKQEKLTNRKIAQKVLDLLK